LHAKRRELLTLVRPSLDALIEQSFFVSPGIYQEVLVLANEQDS
jgi:predicted nucleic acid-binding protein